MTKSTSKKALRTINGTIVGASQIQDFKTQKGKVNQSAMLHIQEDENDPCSAQVAVKVTGDMCNYVGCIGTQVTVDYVVRVFDFAKNGRQMLGNDIYAINIHRLGR